jgi:putative ABC transport system permease protein
MKYFPLVWAGLWRKPGRLILTVLSVIAAFTLFGISIGLNASFSHVQGLARADRIFVNARFGGQLPEAMAKEIAALPGVTHVATLSFVGGYYQMPRNNTFVMMVGSDLRAVWPELPLTPQQYGQLAANPTGAFYSRTMAQRWKLKQGDVFPIKSPTIARADGTQTWAFKVLDIVPDIPTMPAGYAIGNLAYLDQAKLPADRYKGVGFRLLVADPAQGDAMVKLIDQHFASSGVPTRSITEKNAYDTSGSGIDLPFLTQSIAAAGLFMILFLTGNSIAQSVRERIPEFAVLKTMGFSDKGVMVLVFAEAAIPCLTGAAVGIALARWIAAIFPRLLPPGVGLPPPYLPPSVLAVALICAALVAAASAIIPATRIARLDVATALSGR